MTVGGTVGSSNVHTTYFHDTGAGDESVGHYFAGVIDELRLYNRELGYGEVGHLAGAAEPTNAGEAGTYAVARDGRGNQLATERFAFLYDAYNRIIQVTDLKHEPGSGSPSYARYGYDGYGRRVRKQYFKANGTPMGGAWPDVFVVYSGVTPIEEWTIETTPKLLRRYVYEKAINYPVLVEENLNYTGANPDNDFDDPNERRLLITDDRGTLMGVVTQPDVGASYELVERLKYNTTGVTYALQDDDGDGSWTDKTYGDIPGADNVSRSTLAPFGWTGMYRDRYTGLYHTHFREYDPIHRRWLQPDPSGYADGMNLHHAYFDVQGKDSWGLSGNKCNKPKWDKDPADYQGDYRVIWQDYEFNSRYKIRVVQLQVAGKVKNGNQPDHFVPKIGIHAVNDWKLRHVPTWFVDKQFKLYYDELDPDRNERNHRQLRRWEAYAEHLNTEVKSKLIIADAAESAYQVIPFGGATMHASRGHYKDAVKAGLFDAATTFGPGALAKLGKSGNLARSAGAAGKLDNGAAVMAKKGSGKYTRHGSEKLYHQGANADRAREIMDEAAKASGRKLDDYVDDVVYTTGSDPWFAVVNNRRIIAIDRATLNGPRHIQLINGVHELNHARHSARFTWEKYLGMIRTTKNAPVSLKIQAQRMKGRIEYLVETRALRIVDKYLGGLTAQQKIESHQYIQRALSMWRG